MASIVKPRRGECIVDGDGDGPPRGGPTRDRSNRDRSNRNLPDHERPGRPPTERGR